MTCLSHKRIVFPDKETGMPGGDKGGIGYDTARANEQFLKDK
jgi:hypothetical protein